MSRKIELHPGEQIIYRTATPLLQRFGQYFVGIFLFPLFGMGIRALAGWGFYHYSDVVLTSQRVMLKKPACSEEAIDRFLLTRSIFQGLMVTP